MPPKALALPTAPRLAAGALLALGFLTSLTAVGQLELALSASELVPSSGATARELAAFGSFVVSLEASQWQRVPVLAFLSVASSVVFFTALRVRWPGSGRRGPFAELMGKAAVVTAVLRTIDGAQLYAMARRASAAADRVAAAPSASDAVPAEALALPIGAPGLILGLTILIVGTYALAGRYFQTPRLIAVLDELDANVPEEEE
jgi:hypothetical protein